MLWWVPQIVFTTIANVWWKRNKQSTIWKISMSTHFLGPWPNFQYIVLHGRIFWYDFYIDIYQIFRWLLYVNYGSFVFIVPFCYIKIFLFLKTQKGGLELKNHIKFFISNSSVSVLIILIFESSPNAPVSWIWNSKTIGSRQKEEM